METSLGKSVPRREGAAKLCGKAQFVDDLPREDVWVAATVRADVPHGRLLGIRRDEQFDWSRVVTVTAGDIPGENVVPVALRDQLAGILDDGNRIRIASLTTMTELRRSEILHDACPLIRQAATATGGVQSQNRATVGGRIVSASPAGETLPVWLALDAEIELVSRDTNPGARLAALERCPARPPPQPNATLKSLLSFSRCSMLVV